VAAEKWFKSGTACVAVALVSACGGSGAPASQATVTVTTSASVSVTPSPDAPSLSASPTTTPSSPAPPQPTTQAPPVQAGVVPNVVGVNHQLAQDTMQAAGFYILTEEDATGQERLLISDRNWVVVSQQPKGGSRAAADTTIILRSKKIGE